MRACPTLPDCTLLPPRSSGMKPPSSPLFPVCTHKLYRRILAGPVAAGIALSAAPALAQDAPLEDEFSVQRFNPAPGPRNYFTTRGVRTEGEMAWSAGLVINYANEPFTVVSCASEGNCDDPTTGRQDIKVIENL